MKPIKVTKQIKKFPQDSRYKGKHFFSECEIEPNFPVDYQDITIQSLTSSSPIINASELIIPDSLSYLSADDIVDIINQVLKISYDPLTVAKHLKNMDTSLGGLMQENKIIFVEKDTFPAHLLAGRGHFIPGAPPPSYRPKNKGRLLDRLLLEQENKRGVNTRGYSIKFIGYISNMIAELVMTNGFAFTENKQITRVLLHGSYSHRLMLEAFASAINQGEISLKIKSGRTLSFLEFMDILILVKAKGFSLWEHVMDTVEDTQCASSNPLDSKLFNYSCRSPFVMNSLLLCFGKELDLPNLQYYLLDSHYKAAYQMVLRSKEKMYSGKISNNSQLDIPNERIYELCMEYFSTMASSFGEVGGYSPFALDENAILSDSRYEGTFWGPGIVKKITKPKEISEYIDWNEYFQDKKGLLKKRGTLFNPIQKQEPSNNNINPLSAKRSWDQTLNNIETKEETNGSMVSGVKKHKNDEDDTEQFALSSQNSSTVN